MFSRKYLKFAVCAGKSRGLFKTEVVALSPKEAEPIKNRNRQFK